jgi:predicted Fe-S protein YdhL (DUF1289 family)
MTVDAMNLIATCARVAGAAGTFDDEFVPSPCVSVCRMNSAPTALCEGCFRTLDEIAAWSRMDDAGKREVWARIAQRVAHHRTEEARP